MFGNSIVERPGDVRGGVPAGQSEPRCRTGRFRPGGSGGWAVRGLGRGAAVGAAVLGLALGGCTDEPTPSETAMEAAPAHQQKAAGSLPPGHLRTIAVLDDCLPTDPGWTPTGGCTLAGGRVSAADFFAALPQGHPAWRNDPAYAKVTLRGNAFRNIRVVNQGGRDHTFTRVAAFGGGIVPPLNATPVQPAAPECEDAAAFGGSFLPPGGSLSLESLQPGVHRYQCCIHPWMRTELRVN